MPSFLKKQVSDYMDKESYTSFVGLFSQRKNKKEKARFIENAQNYFKNLNIDLSIHEVKFGLTKISHLVFGDLKSAEVVLCAGYDTGELLLVGNGDYYPLQENRNRLNNFINLTLTMLLSIIIAIIGIIFVAKSGKQEGVIKVLSIISGFVIIFWANGISKGLPNRSTCTKTASIYLMLELAKKLRNKEVAYVFLDKGSFSKIGINFLNDDNLFSGKQLKIYFDCFGDGNQLLISYDNMAEEKAKQIKSYCTFKSEGANLRDYTPNRFDDLENIIAISNVFVEEDHGWKVKNVKKDTDLTTDPKAIDAVEQAVEKMMGR